MSCEALADHCRFSVSIEPGRIYLDGKLVTGGLQLVQRPVTVGMRKTVAFRARQRWNRKRRRR